ncbi:MULTISPECIES: type I-G CRISPR-associated protein Csb2 [Derxia]|uniref:Type I-G CRISPR-associated protein Csb2 n=1 Tax=Derxia gummosa DSM 723 TaxID=1121388 RepID=A0A8B6X2A2_9BURK|nr:MULTISPECIES: type I-U CRISPR-associated protein Csb2 [Derxia]
MAAADHLVLEARFLGDSYGGSEWPPAPFRLMQAIVAGNRSIDAPGLGWLEAQPAPVILAADASAPIDFRRSIPNNARPGDSGGATTMREVRRRLVRGPVRYCWPLRDAADRDAANQLIASAEKVHTLGTGEDMCVVRGLIAGAAPQSAGDIRLWQPVADDIAAFLPGTDGARLRVPVPGSLQALEARFQAFQRRLQAGDQGWAQPVQRAALHGTRLYQPSEAAPRSLVLALRLTRPDDAARTARFAPADAVVVAGMLRHAAMQLAQPLGDEVAGFAAGHAPEGNADCRLSWVPLPTVGAEHADGRARRALWIARAADHAPLLSLAARLGEDGVPLVDEDTGEARAIARPIAVAGEPVLPAYLDAAREWVTVTPMVLPGDFGGGDLRVMTKLLHKALRESGIDPGLLAGAEFSRQPLIRQAPALREVRLKRWQARSLILYHLRLRFREPVRGPLVLGRGRHYGLGLFCANPK